MITKIDYSDMPQDFIRFIDDLVGVLHKNMFIAIGKKHLLIDPHDAFVKSLNEYLSYCDKHIDVIEVKANEGMDC